MNEQMQMLSKPGPGADYQALHAVVDIFHRTDKFDAIHYLISQLKDDILPKNLVGFDMLSYMYYKAKDYKNAIRYGELALGAASSPPEKAACRYNIGKCYLNGNEPYKARNSFDIVSKIHPDRVDVKLDLAAALYACNQKEDAYDVLKKLDSELWRFNEENAMAIQFNLGAHAIRSGNFKAGMDYLSLGRKIRIWGSYTHRFPIPEWEGQVVEGANILIIGEGGIGDELINARFIKHIQDLGMNASFASCHNLSSIMSRMPFDKTLNYRKFTTDIPTIREYDFWAPAMNLPKLVGADFDNLWYGPYLSTNGEHDVKWSEILPQTGRFKVGIRWSGNPLYEHDLHRSLPLSQLWEKIKDKDWDVYSIQRDHDLEKLAGYPDITPLHSHLDTFEDALSCINSLDLIVTSCTSVAHAAAALGKKVVVFTPIMDYYIWAEDRSDSSWYGDNLRLCRQTKPKSWDDAFVQFDRVLLELGV